jgi:hypothetical protein
MVCRFERLVFESAADARRLFSRPGMAGEARMVRWRTCETLAMSVYRDAKGRQRRKGRIVE